MATATFFSDFGAQENKVCHCFHFSMAVQYRVCSMMLSWWLSGKESACSAGDQSSIPGSGRSLEKGWLPTPVFLPGGFHERGATVNGVEKDWTWLRDWACKHIISIFSRDKLKNQKVLLTLCHCQYYQKIPVQIFFPRRFPKCL